MLPYLHQQKDRMTLPGMVMSGALLLGFYALPGWTLDAGNTMLGMKLDYTLNQLLGVQTGGADITVTFDFWRLLGCVITFLPWVTPWLRFARARLLNILPLLLLLACLWSYMRGCVILQPRQPRARVSFLAVLAVMPPCNMICRPWCRNRRPR